MERVLVLLSTYNGERYLREQLTSLFSQELPEGTELRILVRDDGSSDGTIAILREYEEEGRLSFYRGERNLGPAGSFLSLMKRAEHYEWGEERAEARTYYALCDQDDVWLPDKLSRALSLLLETGREEAALYYGLPRLVDAELRPLPLRRDARERMLDFASALIKSNSTGCTMLFTRALLLKINRSEPDTEKITMSGSTRAVLRSEGGLSLMKIRRFSTGSMGTTRWAVRAPRERCLSAISIPCSIPTGFTVRWQGSSSAPFPAI